MSRHGRFVTPLRARWSHRKQEWQLECDLVFERPDGSRYVAPKGSWTDGASIRRSLRSFTPSDNRARPAAALHDYHYRSGDVSRSEADRVFYHAMRASGINRVSAWAYWLAVRVGGRWSYNQNPSEE